MFRRIEATHTFLTDSGQEIKIYGERSLPSDGQIRHFMNVAHGLKERQALSPARFREYIRVLQEALKRGDKSKLSECKGIIIELDSLLDKSPSERRGNRVRSSRRPHWSGPHPETEYAS